MNGPFVGFGRRAQVSRTSRRGAWRMLPVVIWTSLVVLRTLTLQTSRAAEQSTTAGVAPVGLQELLHRAFHTEDGAPNSCLALAQTADGFLWIGTLAGLYRYDGARFDMEVTRQLFHPSVKSLLAESDGSLWIGYNFGGVSVLRNGRVHHLDHTSLPPGSVLQLFRSPDGILWVATTSGLARLDGERWQTMDAAVGYSGEAPNWLGIVDGRLGVETRTAAYLYLTSAGHFERRPPGEAEAARYGVHKGSLWRPDLRDTNGQVPSQIMLDRAGALWMAGFRTLVRYQWSFATDAAPREERFTTGMGLTGDVTAILEDREGNVWVGTDKGLDRFSIPTLRRVPFPDGAYNALLIPGDQGDLWVGRTDHPILRLRDSQPLPQLGNSVMAAFRARNGTLWTAGREGLFEYSQGGVVTKLPPPVSETQLPDITQRVSTYQAIAADAGGAVWLSIARAGLFRWDHGTWTQPQQKYGLPPGAPIRLSVDSRDRLWLAYRNNQLAVLDGERLTLFTQADGLNVGNILSVDVEPTHVWIGGDHGVAVFVGRRFIPVRGPGDVNFQLTTGLVETAQGELWLNSAADIYRIPSASVSRVLAGAAQPVEFEAFDWLDGLDSGNNPIRPGPTMLQIADGRLCFARFEGVWCIDPAHIHRSRVPPIVSIEDLVSAGIRYGVHGDLKLPKESRNLRIDYNAASLTYPERTRFRYRLVGVDEGWQEAGQRRQAYYTKLSPGHYEFVVMAANKDGVWSTRSAVLQFTLAPAFYQTLIFKIGATLAAILLLVLLFIVRLEQSRGQYRRSIDARHAERERIARDMHDTLLQGVQALLFRLQMWEQDPKTPESLRKQMARVILHARSTALEGRERILMMRRADAQPADLTDSLTAIGNEASTGKDADFEVTVVGAARVLTIDAKEQLIDIAREGVRNAYQHAGADHIVVSLHYRRRSILMSIADDGCGIDPAVLGGRELASHFGLTGMRERAKHLGGRFRLQSRPGVGTRIEVVFPARVAFRDAFRWPWQRRGAVAPVADLPSRADKKSRASSMNRNSAFRSK